MLARDLTKEHVGKDLYINDQGNVTMARLITIMGDFSGLRRLLVEYVAEGTVEERVIADVSLFSTVKILEVTREDVLEKLSVACYGKSAGDWLHGSNDYLDGARPVDLINQERYEEVLQALELCFQ